MALTTLQLGRGLAVIAATAALPLFAAACSSTRTPESAQVPATPAQAQQTNQTGSYGYNGAGTRGGTDVDGEDPTGPRQPDRYTTPQPYPNPSPGVVVPAQ